MKRSLKSLAAVLIGIFAATIPIVVLLGLTGAFGAQRTDSPTGQCGKP